MKNEAALVKASAAALHREFPDAWIFKVVGSPMQALGVPDVLVLNGGRFCGLEFKHQKEGESEQHARSRASRHQLRQMDLIRRAGGVAEVVLTVDEAVATVRGTTS